MSPAKVNLTQALPTKKPKIGKALIIAIDGHGGSGKSTFATWLGNELSAQVVRQDDFASWDNPLNWWPSVIEKVFVPIDNGAKTLNYPRSKWWENHNPEPVVEQPVTPIMILEGVSSSRKEFRNYIGFSIFVDTPREFCYRRGVERDKATGKSEEELGAMWRKWFQEEDVYMERDRPKEHADLVVDGTRPFEEQVAF